MRGTEIGRRLRRLAAKRRRFGYRRPGYLLAREGLTPNPKKLLRIYREEATGSAPRWPQARPGRQGADGASGWADPRWSLDFFSDTLTCSRR